MTRHLTEKNLAELSAQLETTGNVDMSKLSPGPKRRHLNNEESQYQQAVIRWWDFSGSLRYSLPSILLCSIPNGGNLGARMGAIMKRMGLRSGAPDLVLFVPRGGFPALFVEMKAAKGVTSDEQILFHAYLTGYGYRVRICRSAQAAITEIENYLKL